MKKLTTDGKDICVCEFCEKKFEVHDKITIIAQNIVENFTSWKNVEWPSWRIADENILRQLYFHHDCYEKFTKELDVNTIKTSLNALNKEARRAIYLYLYNTWSCRL